MRRVSLVWVVPAAVAILMAGAIALYAARAMAPVGSGSYGGAFANPILGTFGSLAMAAIGALILSRLPAHPIGRLFAAAALIAACSEITAQYGLLWAAAPERAPGGLWAAWVASWVWFTYIVLIVVVLPLTFPTGRPLSPRWRPALPLAALVAILLSLHGALASGPLEALPAVENPVGLLDPAVAEATGIPVFALLLALIATAGASMVVRLRRSRGVERQQLKWIVYAMALMAAAFVAGAVVYRSGREQEDTLVEIAIVAGMTLVPLAAGVAILRYGLYQIDVLINRTLVYGALSASLAASYASTVFVLGSLLSPVAAGSELAVAGSTLAVAALFQPLRSRIQAAVDRRFSRQRYDAKRTLDAFAVRLRDQVDLDALEREVLGVVGQTVQPSSAALWLREPRR